MPIQETFKTKISRTKSVDIAQNEGNSYHGNAPGRKVWVLYIYIYRHSNLTKTNKALK